MGRRRLLAVLVGCLGTLFFSLDHPARALKPLRGYPALPSDYGIRYELFTVTTSDSVELAAWFYPVQDTIGIANQWIGRLVPVPDSLKTAPPARPPWDGKRRPTVVVCNGDGGNMTQNILYAYHLCTRGLNVLTFDWRGFGESGRWPAVGEMERDRLCYVEFLLDYAAVLDTLERRLDVDPTRIGLFGYSTGAYLSFAMAASRPEIAAYAGRALLTSFDDLLPLLKVFAPDRAFSAPPDYPPSLLPINAAERVRIPVFLIVGEKDSRTPPWMSERIAAKLPGVKEVWVVPKAEHGGAAGPEFTNYPEFFLRLAEFFGKHLQAL